MLTRKVLSMVVAGLAVAGCATDADGPATSEVPGGEALLVGNPSCAEAGARLGRKLGNREAAIAITAPGSWELRLDEQFRVLLASQDGRSVDWAADTGIDAVLVVGDRRTQAYVYDPEGLVDAGLTAPEAKFGGVPRVTGVVFCYDYELTVTASARTSLVRTTTWGLELAPEKVDVTVPAGHVKLVPFVASVFPTAVIDSSHAVRGTLRITNPTNAPVELLAIVEPMTKAPLRLFCPKAPPPTSVPAYGAVVCGYSMSLPGGAPRMLTFEAVTRGTVLGGHADVPIDFRAGDVVTRDAKTWVWDDHAGFLGVADGARTFAFELPIGPYEYCAVGIFMDGARAYGGDSGKRVEARTWLRVKVACDG